VTDCFGAQSDNASKTSSGAALPASQALAHKDSETLGHHMISECSCSVRQRPITRYPGRMPVAVIWLIFALVLAGGEALTGDMSLLMLSGGALAAAGGSWLLDLPLWADAAVFLVVSVLLLVLVRPALRRRLTPAKGLPTGIKALEGKTALVLNRVARDEGQVKLDGQVWTARPLNDSDVYEPGERVTVMQIDGATAVVFNHV
jgi:membrane protein implicated in regulation of membrane protease activity